MMRLFALSLLLIFSQPAPGQTNLSTPLQTGDLLFQNLECGPLCDAIEMVTTGYDGKKFSHIGMVYIKGDATYVIEAIGKDVHLTPIEQFAARSGNILLVGRLKQPYTKLIPAAIHFSLQQLGLPYDENFLYGNGSYYCSELIYDAFKYANNDRPFFHLEPMTFKKPESDAFFPAWIDYYKELGAEIPEGKPGINPGSISMSDKLAMLN